MYLVEHSFRIPDLHPLLPRDGRIQQRSEHWKTTWFDTVDRDLAAAGLLVSSRSVAGTHTGWTLTGPDGILLGATGVAGLVPPEIDALTAGVRRGSTVREVAVLEIQSLRTTLVDAAGTALVSLADQVASGSQTTGHQVSASQWRTLDIELEDGEDKSVARALTKMLARAGAERCGPQKFPMGPAVPDEPDDGSAGAALVRHLRVQERSLVECDLRLRSGGDQSGSGRDAVAAARAAVRRMRSTINVYRRFFDSAAVEEFDTELGWLAKLLGAMRDPQVRLGRIRSALAGVPDDLLLGPVSADLTQYLTSDALRQRESLREAMDDARYYRLLQACSRWAAGSMLSARGADPVKSLGEPARKAARKALRRLASGAGHTEPEVGLRAARKAATRARHAAEIASKTLHSKQYRADERRLTDIHDVLAEYQDSQDSARLLRRLGAAAGVTPESNGFSYGLLYAREAQLTVDLHRRIARAARQARKA